MWTTGSLTYHIQHTNFISSRVIMVTEPLAKHGLKLHHQIVCKDYAIISPYTFAFWNTFQFFSNQTKRTFQ